MRRRECRWDRVIGAAHHSCLRNVTVHKEEMMPALLGTFTLWGGFSVVFACWITGYAYRVALGQGRSRRLGRHMLRHVSTPSATGGGNSLE